MKARYCCNIGKIVTLRTLIVISVQSFSLKHKVCRFSVQYKKAHFLILEALGYTSNLT